MAKVTRARDGKPRPPVKLPLSPGRVARTQAKVVRPAEGVRLKLIGLYWHMYGSYEGKRIRESTFETDLARAEMKRALRIEELFEERIRQKRARLAGIEDIPDALNPVPRPTRDEVQPPVAVRPPPAVPPQAFVAPSSAPPSLPSVRRTVEEALLLYIGEHPEVVGSNWLIPKQLSTAALNEARRLLAGVQKLDKARGAAAMCSGVKDSYVEAVASAVMNDNVSPPTVKRAILNPLRAALRRAHKRWGVDEGCPAPVLTSIQDAKGRDICIPVHVAERMIAAALADADFLTWTVLQFGFCEGPRASEMFALEWGDLDLGRTCVTFYDVKSDRTRDGVRDRTLNDLRPRSIAALERYRGETGSREGPVFLNHWSEPYSSPNTFDKRVNKGMRRCAKAVGFKLWKECTCHALRHTATSWHDLVDGSKAVRIRMDWRDIRSFDRYCHPAPGTTADDVRRFWGVGKNLTHSPGRTA